MSAIFSHSIRHEWIKFIRSARFVVLQYDCGSPMSLPSEFQALVLELSLREQLLVMLAGSTG